MKPIEWLGDSLRILDQTELPQHEVYVNLDNYRAVVTAIKQLKVRGAPAIGITAAYGMALGALRLKSTNKKQFLHKLDRIFQEFADSRPTAVNLFHAINCMTQVIQDTDSISEIKEALLNTAISLHSNEERAMSSLSKYGAALLKDGFTVLTHCNTGQLATGVEYGTAMGVIKAAVEQGKRIHVYVGETRPLLQGARLTTWELGRQNIPVTLITDNMAGHFINRKKIDCVIVGADRIAANGDTANKIGTYALGVLARENHIPFYVAAPTSSIDCSVKTGADIPIEERSPEEVLRLQGIRIAPRGIPAVNPAFDITPQKYLSSIITEKGIICKPFKRNIKSFLQEGS